LPAGFTRPTNNFLLTLIGLGLSAKQSPLGRF
jgi:hypothetical protein